MAACASGTLGFGKGLSFALSKLQNLLFLFLSIFLLALPRTRRYSCFFLMSFSARWMSTPRWTNPTRPTYSPVRAKARSSTSGYHVTAEMTRFLFVDLAKHLSPVTCSSQKFFEMCAPDLYPPSKSLSRFLSTVFAFP